ncbi:MAG: hypothetical protein U0942_16005 [Parvibaculum sp.]|uniref:hypothetical protein n=1 Tax=Parvibaculum sp. TaxID=2024848 RepID=UPI002ABA998E|nr:hypothetical protein [Parvibaculum sp.]MDZ4382836.1 hypothetical protein [Parvibaculum sp.]
MPHTRDLRESLRDESREWLQTVIATTGLSVSAIASKAGVSGSNLRKLMREPDWPHPLSDAIKRKISAATGVALPGESRPSRMPGLSEPEVRQYQPAPDEDMPFSERNGADWWKVETRLLNLEGYLPGDAVLVDMNETPRANDIVVAQVTQQGSQKVETVFRKYEPPFLTCRTTDASYPRPELVDGDRVIVMGVVVSAWRKRARSAA